MQRNRSPLPTPHGMRDVCRIIGIRIAHGINTRNVRDHAFREVGFQFIIDEVDADVFSDTGFLLVLEVGEEGGALDGWAGFEVDLEEVVFGEGGATGVFVEGSGVLEAFDGDDGAVVDGHLVELEPFLPAAEFGVVAFAVLGCVGAVGEDDDVGVKSQEFEWCCG